MTEDKLQATVAKHQERVKKVDEYKAANATSIVDAAKAVGVTVQAYGNSRQFLKRKGVTKSAETTTPTIDSHQERVNKVEQYMMANNASITRACKALKIAVSSYYRSVSITEKTAKKSKKSYTKKMKVTKRNPSTPVLNTVAIPEYTNTRNPVVIVFGDAAEVHSILNRFGINNVTTN